MFHGFQDTESGKLFIGTKIEEQGSEEIGLDLWETIE
jgi:hypothetical protein